MTGEEVFIIREALGTALGRRISQADLARLLQLAPASGKDTVRSWEDGKKDVSGSAAVALQLLGYGAGVGALPAEIGNMDINFRVVMRCIAQSMLGLEVTRPAFGNVIKADNEAALCSDCPPAGHSTDSTRCEPCPRRQAGG